MAVSILKNIVTCVKLLLSLKFYQKEKSFYFFSNSNHLKFDQVIIYIKKNINICDMK
jgi:hypothetical protein